VVKEHVDSENNDIEETKSAHDIDIKRH